MHDVSIIPSLPLKELEYMYVIFLRKYKSWLVVMPENILSFCIWQGSTIIPYALTL